LTGWPAKTPVERRYIAGDNISNQFCASSKEDRGNQRYETQVVRYQLTKKKQKKRG